MARKTDKVSTHDFTSQIHSSRRVNTRFHAMENHNEKNAKSANKLCCHDCRHFSMGCSELIGKYHKTCDEFDWW